MRNWEKIGGPLLRTPTRCRKKTQMRPNQSRAILIFLITPTTTWLFAGYPYTLRTEKATKILNKNSFFNRVHGLTYYGLYQKKFDKFFGFTHWPSSLSIKEELSLLSDASVFCTRSSFPSIFFAQCSNFARKWKIKQAFVKVTSFWGGGRLKFTSCCYHSCHILPKSLSVPFLSSAFCYLQSIRCPQLNLRMKWEANE